MRQVVLITGASSGVGAAAAKRFVRRGAKVLMVARSAEKLAALAGEIGYGAIACPCDAADGEAVSVLREKILAEHGVPDVIVNSAGAGAWKTVQDTSPKEAVQMMQAPYFAAFNITQAFLPGMLERGTGILIHINSPACIAAWPKSAGYAAARAALFGLHRALSQDLVGTGVESCHVIFGEIDSEYFETNNVDRSDVPWLGKIVPTLEVEGCGLTVADLAITPRAHTVRPWLLRPLLGFATLMPRVGAWALRF